MVEKALIGRGGLSRVGTNVAGGSHGGSSLTLLPASVQAGAQYRSLLCRLTSGEAIRSRSQTVMSNRSRGRRSRPYAFTEQGVAMLSIVLRSERAVLVNIEIMRALVRLRQMLTTRASALRAHEGLPCRRPI